MSILRYKCLELPFVPSTPILRVLHPRLVGSVDAVSHHGYSPYSFFIDLLPCDTKERISPDERSEVGADCFPSVVDCFFPLFFTHNISGVGRSCSGFEHVGFCVEKTVFMRLGSGRPLHITEAGDVLTGVSTCLSLDGSWVRFSSEGSKSRAALVRAPLFP